MFTLWKIGWRGSSEKATVVKKERMMGTWTKMVAREYIVGGRIQKS